MIEQFDKECMESAIKKSRLGADFSEKKPTKKGSQMSTEESTNEPISAESGQNSAELLPCPFCGSDLINYYDDDLDYTIECFNCKVQMYTNPNYGENWKQMCRDRWNTRKKPSQEEVSEYLDKFHKAQKEYGVDAIGSEECNINIKNGNDLVTSEKTDTEQSYEEKILELKGELAIAVTINDDNMEKIATQEKKIKELQDRLYEYEEKVNHRYDK
jgi:hypothetical protein